MLLMLKFPLSVMMSIEQSILLSLIDLYAEHYPYPLLVFPAGLCFIVNLKKKAGTFYVSRFSLKKQLFCLMGTSKLYRGSFIFSILEPE
jgi:hypothetical protein